MPHVMSHHESSLVMTKVHFKYDGKTVSTAPSSNYEHVYTSLGRLQNTPIAVGGYKKKVEALQAGSWSELADFPFVEINIYSYSMVTFDETLFIFGGVGYGHYLDIAVKCSRISTDGNMWTPAGSLMSPRRSHRSVVIGDTIMHIGGSGIE